MAKAYGYALDLPDDRMKVFVDRLSEGLSFGQPVADFERSRQVPLVCFVLSNGHITCVALGGRGIRAGTDLRRLNLETSEQLSKPLDIKEVVARLPSRVRATVEKRFATGGPLGEKGFAAVVAAVRSLAPETDSILKHFGIERSNRIGRLSPAVRKSLALQKDATTTAMSIAQIDRHELQDWSLTDETPTSFLEGLKSTRLREDPMIVHDFTHLPGFELIKTLPYNAALFVSGNERLTVIIANRLPLEQQTGTDLIYFSETYQSFVMVQYKAMEVEVDASGRSRPVFRLPNPQLAIEVRRMDVLVASLKECEANSTCNGFRLTDNPFFLKLCPRVVFDPDDIGLVPGMYLPLDYWKLLERHNEIRGPRGGLCVTFDNVGRHLDNTAFSTVVSKAWVGTTPSQSIVLRDAIRQTLESGRALALAVKELVKSEESSSWPGDDLLE